MKSLNNNQLIEGIMFKIQELDFVANYLFEQPYSELSPSEKEDANSEALARKDMFEDFLLQLKINNP